MLCPSSWVVAELAADSVRYVAETIGFTMITVAIVLGISLPILLLSCFIPFCFAVIVCLLSPCLCCCVGFFVKKKRQSQVIEITSHKPSDTEVGLAVTTVTADTLREETLKDSQLASETDVFHPFDKQKRLIVTASN